MRKPTCLPITPETVAELERILGEVAYISGSTFALDCVKEIIDSHVAMSDRLRWRDYRTDPPPCGETFGEPLIVRIRGDLAPASHIAVNSDHYPSYLEKQLKHVSRYQGIEWRPL